MKLMQKKINYNDSKILYNRKVSEEMLAQDFDIKTGSWSVRDGWIIGKNPWKQSRYDCFQGRLFRKYHVGVYCGDNSPVHA